MNTNQYTIRILDRIEETIDDPNHEKGLNRIIELLSRISTNNIMILKYTLIFDKI